MEEGKDKFYDDLQKTYDSVPKHIIMILGDLNAKIGKEKAYGNVTGNIQYMTYQNEMEKWSAILQLRIT
jgi:hypothetical protein